MSQDLTPAEIQANIQKLKEKVGDARIGGKGSQRRKVKVVSKQVAGNDKVVKNIVKKVGAHPLGVDEINFFRDDNTILHFKNPEAYASIQNNTFIVSGEPETKTIKDLLPEIIQQLGPKQSKMLESLVTSSVEGAEDAPELVEDKPATTPENLDTVE